MSDKDYFDESHSAHNAADTAHEAGAPAAEEQEEAASSATNDSSAAGPTPEDVIEKLAKENGALKEQVLRAAAEMENLRKRTMREIADAKTYAASGFARDMLSVADNLNRALSAIPAEARKADAQLKMLADGVEMTGRAMLSVLERHGVRKIETVGQKFDPNFHEAITSMEDKAIPHNTVKHEAEPGYMIGGRVLRPAKVVIAQGGEKTADAKD